MESNQSNLLRFFNSAQTKAKDAPPKPNQQKPQKVQKVQKPAQKPANPQHFFFLNAQQKQALRLVEKQQQLLQERADSLQLASQLIPVNAEEKETAAETAVETVQASSSSSSSSSSAAAVHSKPNSADSNSSLPILSLSRQLSEMSQAMKPTPASSASAVSWSLCMWPDWQQQHVRQWEAGQESDYQLLKSRVFISDMLRSRWRQGSGSESWMAELYLKQHQPQVEKVEWLAQWTRCYMDEQEELLDKVMVVENGSIPVADQAALGRVYGDELVRQAAIERLWSMDSTSSVHLPFTDQYAPKSSAEILCDATDRVKIDKIREWIASFKKRLVSSPDSQESDSDFVGDSSGDSSDSDFLRPRHKRKRLKPGAGTVAPCPLDLVLASPSTLQDYVPESLASSTALLLHSTTATFKTALVYAFAKELGLEVMEFTPGCGRRSGADLMALIGESTKSHRVLGKSGPVKGTDQSTEQSLKQKQQRKKKKKAQRVSTDEEEKEEENSEKNRKINESNDEDNENDQGEKTGRKMGSKRKQTSRPAKSSSASMAPANAFFRAFQKQPVESSTQQSTKTPLSEQAPRKIAVILLEEIDVLYQEDVGFWKAVIKLIIESKRPIIMTCNDLSAVPPELTDLLFTLDPFMTLLSFRPPPFDLCCAYLHAIACHQKKSRERPAVEQFVKTLWGNRVDLRLLLNNWQIELLTNTKREVIPEPNGSHDFEQILNERDWRSFVDSYVQSQNLRMTVMEQPHLQKKLQVSESGTDDYVYRDGLMHRSFADYDEYLDRSWDDVLIFQRNLIDDMQILAHFGKENRPNRFETEQMDEKLVLMSEKCLRWLSLSEIFMGRVQFVTETVPYLVQILRQYHRFKKGEIESQKVAEELDAQEGRRRRSSRKTKSSSVYDPYFTGSLGIVSEKQFHRWYTAQNGS